MTPSQQIEQHLKEVEETTADVIRAATLNETQKMLPVINAQSALVAALRRAIQPMIAHQRRGTILWDKDLSDIANLLLDKRQE